MKKMKQLYSKCITGPGDKPVMVEVELDHISGIDINPRIGGLVEVNLEKLRGAVGEFDAIHLGLFDNKLIIADGYHRTHVTREAGHTKILAYIKEYETMEELRKAAFIANVSHGERLNENDIADNLHRFFMEKLALNASVKKGTVGKEYGLTNDRQIRTYINWGIVAKECLELDSLAEIEKSKAEELYIMAKEEVPGEISEETKNSMKTVFMRYGSASKAVIREAAKLAKEGKDYYDEMEKVEIAEKEAAAAKAAESSEPIGDDAIDRTGVADYTTGEVTPTAEEGVASAIIDDLIGNVKAMSEGPTEEEVQEAIEKKEEKAKKEVKSFRPIVEASSQNIKGLYLLITSNTEIDIHPEDVEVVDDLMNVLSEIRATCFPDAATKTEEETDAFL